MAKEGNTIEFRGINTVLILSNLLFKAASFGKTIVDLTLYPFLPE